MAEELTQLQLLGMKAGSCARCSQGRTLAERPQQVWARECEVLSLRTFWVSDCFQQYFTPSGLTGSDCPILSRVND